MFTRKIAQTERQTDGKTDSCTKTICYPSTWVQCEEGGGGLRRGNIIIVHCNRPSFYSLYRTLFFRGASELACILCIFFSSCTLTVIPISIDVQWTSLRICVRTVLLLPVLFPKLSITAKADSEQLSLSSYLYHVNRYNVNEGK